MKPVADCGVTVRKDEWKRQKIEERDDVEVVNRSEREQNECLEEETYPSARQWPWEHLPPVLESLPLCARRSLGYRQRMLLIRKSICNIRFKIDIRGPAYH